MGARQRRRWRIWGNAAGVAFGVFYLLLVALGYYDLSWWAVAWGGALTLFINDLLDDLFQ